MIPPPSHTPLAHSVPCPQCCPSLHGRVSQPLDALPSQSKKPALQPTRAQVPLAQVEVPLTAAQTAILTAAGYPDQPGPQTVFFTDARGDQTFNGYGVFDMSINYDIPVFRTVKPWIKFDVYNLFNNEKLIAWSTTVTPNKATSVDSLGLPTGYTKGARFGQPTSNSDFPTSTLSPGLRAFRHRRVSTTISSSTAG